MPDSTFVPLSRPDDVGTAEYRLIHAHLEALFGSDPAAFSAELAVASLREIAGHADHVANKIEDAAAEGRDPLRALIDDWLARHAGPGMVRTLLAGLHEIIRRAPAVEPEYQTWAGDTERAERWGQEQGLYEAARIARRTLAGDPPTPED